MAFSSPFTAVTGATILASQWNTSGRDNLNALWVYTTQGDLAYAASATTLARLGIGASGSLLTSSGTAPQWSPSIGASGGLLGSNGSAPSWYAKYAAPGLKNTSGRADYDAADQVINTTTPTDVTGATVTVNTAVTCTIFMWASGVFATNVAGNRALVRCVIGATAQTSGLIHTSSAYYVPFATNFGVATVGAGAITCKLQGYGYSAGNQAIFSSGHIQVFAMVE